MPVLPCSPSTRNVPGGCAERPPVVPAATGPIRDLTGRGVTGQSGHPVFAAMYARMATSLEAGRIGAARRSLLANATGVTLDLGAGIGLNLPHLPPAVTVVHLVEPDPHMIRRLQPGAPEHAVVHQAAGEDLPLPDAGVDTVLATLTLCTVTDLPRVLGEIRRVLRPGGRLLVLEHVLSVRADRARWQNLLQAPWRAAGGGCYPNRDTVRALEGGGFDVSGLSRFSIRGGLLAPEWVTGVIGPSPDAV
jgi:SAM-dependent methyltransferase